MSEKLRPTFESDQEALDTSEESKRSLEALQEKAKEAVHLDETSPELRQTIEQQAISGAETSVGERESSPSQQQHLGAYKELKAQAYEKSLKRTQSQLSSPEKAMSKIIHRPAVEAASNSLAKTAARPSAILGGGISALIGSSILLYLSHTYGFTYSYFAIFVLFAGGFGVGLLVEAIVRVATRRKR